jgi:hypothetical protein
VLPYILALDENDYLNAYNARRKHPTPLNLALVEGTLHLEDRGVDKVLGFVNDPRAGKNQPLNFLPMSSEPEAVYFNAVYTCAEGGKENLVLQLVGTNIDKGITFRSKYGGKLFVQTKLGESFEGHVPNSIESC